MANGQIDTLRHALRWRVLLKYLGVLGLVLAALDAVPLLAAIVLGEAALAPVFAVPVVVPVVLCLPLARLQAPQRLQLNEAFTIVVLSFVLGALAMSWPLAALGGQTWVDGLFEAVSGITTTGLSTLATVEDKPQSFLFARAWLQWYGGLGIVVLSLALFMHNGLFARQLMETEAAGETLVSSTWVYARRILAVYAVLTMAAVAAIWLATGDAFGALVHALAAVSTGGFSSFDASLGHWGAGPAGVVLAFALLGAVALPPASMEAARVSLEASSSVAKGSSAKPVVLCALIASSRASASLAPEPPSPAGVHSHSRPVVSAVAASSRRSSASRASVCGARHGPSCQARW